MDMLPGNRAETQNINSSCAAITLTDGSVIIFHKTYKNCQRWWSNERLNVLASVSIFAHIASPVYFRLLSKMGGETKSKSTRSATSRKPTLREKSKRNAKRKLSPDEYELDSDTNDSTLITKTSKKKKSDESTDSLFEIEPSLKSSSKTTKGIFFKFELKVAANKF